MKTLNDILALIRRDVVINGPIRESPDASVYIGIFRVYIDNDQNVEKVNVIILTTATPSKEMTREDKTTTMLRFLQENECIIAQFRSVSQHDSGGDLWDCVNKIISTSGEQTHRNSVVCAKSITKNTTSSQHTIYHDLEYPDELQNIALLRKQNHDTNIGPKKTLTRDTIKYSISGNDKLTLAIERPLSKTQMLDTTSGLAKKGNLKDAIMEWKTWIYHT